MAIKLPVLNLQRLLLASMQTWGTTPPGFSLDNA
jgi:hypothetical protein